VKDRSTVDTAGEEDPKGRRALRRSQPRRGLAFVFFIGSLSGLGFLLYLAMLPSDVDGRIVGPYSGARLILMAGPLLGAIVMFALGARTVRDRGWGNRVAHLVFGRRETVPRLLAVSTLLAASGVAGLLVYWPQLLFGLTKAHVARLMPYFAWPALLCTVLGATWLLQWPRVRLRFTSAAKDASAASLLFLLSLSVRLPLTRYGLPYQAVWDEVTTYTRALSLIGDSASDFAKPVPGYAGATYGDLLIYTTAVGEVAGLLSGLRSQQVASLDEFVAPPPGVGSIYEGVHASGLPLLYPRILLALINSLASVLVFKALRTYLGSGTWASFLGGLVYAIFSWDVVYYSSYIIPDALATTLSLAALLAAMAAIGDRNGKATPYLACGVFVGLAVSVTIRYASMAVVPFLALALARDRKKFSRKAGLALVGMLGGFLVTSPRALADSSSYLSGMTSLVWSSDTSSVHRLESLVFYMQRIFGPPAIASGLGPLTLIAALIGLGRLLISRPRYALLFVLFGGVHFQAVTPIIERYSRHVLVLFPIACMLAGVGLDMIAGGISDFLYRMKMSNRLPSRAEWLSVGLAREWVGAALVISVFTLLSVSRVLRTVETVKNAAAFETTQVLMARYLEQSLRPGEKVGILDLIPWVEADLQRRAIDFERIGLDMTMDELWRRGITQVVGTDRVEGAYGPISGTIWQTAFESPGDRIAEFGSDSLRSRGYPMGNLYLFVGRIVETRPAGGG